MAVNWEWRDNVWESIQVLHESDPIEETKSSALLVAGWGFGLMHMIGFGSITDKNKDEFYARLAALQGLGMGDGGLITYWNGEASVPLIYTREDIYKRVGLWTNYETMTHAKWVRERFTRMFDSIRDKTKE